MEILRLIKSLINHLDAVKVGSWGVKMEQTRKSLLITRHSRSFFLRNVPVFPSLGHASVVAIYMGVNLVVMFTNFDLANMPLLPNLASRTAW